MKLAHIRSQFAKAGVGLHVADKPIVDTNPDIVQMDIIRGFSDRRRYEKIRIWEGNKDNRIEVVNVDSDLKQLILMVHEPRREYIAEVKDWRTGKTVKHKDHTSEQKRHFLMGVDERQLFIATLRRGVNTVADAHKALKSTELTLAEGKAPGKTIRQGEWFFVHPTMEEAKALAEALHKGLVAEHKKEALPFNRGGNPHTADYLARLPSDVSTLKLKHGFPAQSRSATYVRGDISHSDHKTVKLGSWRRVIKNNEPSGLLNKSGINWID